MLKVQIPGSRVFRTGICGAVLVACLTIGLTTADQTEFLYHGE